MRTSIRTGVALSITGLAAGGIAMLSAGAAEASAATSARMDPNSPICEYRVGAYHGLNVRAKPAGKKVGALRYRKIVFAKKCNNPRGWVKLRKAEGVKLKKIYRGKYVYRSYLMPQGDPW